MDVKYFCLSTDSMSRYNYIKILLDTVLDKFRLLCDLNNYAHNEYVNVDVIKLMHLIL